MATKHGALVVFGSGPGVGVGVASLFAERGFEKIILISRNAERLAHDAKTVRSVGEAEVHELTCDLADSDQVNKISPVITEILGETPLECVLYNAARLGKSDFFDFPPSMLENDLRITVVSLYAVAQWAMPQLLRLAANDSQRTPSLLVTSGMLAKDPSPAVFSLGVGKAGQYSLVHSLHKAYEPKGIHCGLIVIGGTVKDESKVTNSKNIAAKTWELFSQPKGKGDLEVYLEDPNYAEHVRNRDKIDRK